MFENTRDEKLRADPERSQLRKIFTERDRRADDKRDGHMIDISSGYERDRTCVIDAVRVGMDPFVKLGRSAKRQRPEKSGRSDNRDRSTSARAAFHWRRLSDCPTKLATIFSGAQKWKENPPRMR